MQHGQRMAADSSDGQVTTAAAVAAAELKQMSSSQNPIYSRIANFEIERKVQVIDIMLLAGNRYRFTFFFFLDRKGTIFCRAQGNLS